MSKSELADRIRELNEQHKRYIELFLRFALVAGSLSHELRELGVTEVRTHGHIRFAFLGHEILIDYHPCVHDGRLLGKLRFSQKEATAEEPLREFYALYYDESQQVSASPTLGEPHWKLLDESQAWEFIGAALLRFASEDQLPV